MARRNSSNQDVQALVADFADKLTGLVRAAALEDVLATLRGGLAPRRGPGRPRGAKSAPAARSTGGGKRGRRSSANLEQMSANLLAHVTKHPGQRGEQIAQALRTDVTTMRLPMKKLIAEKKIKTKGQRRGMMYFAASHSGAGKGKG